MKDTGRAPLIAGNWKMHMTIPEALPLASAAAEAATSLAPAKLILIPPFTALSAVRGSLAGSQVGLGGQNLFWEDKGAFTGEVSPAMLKDAGCSHALIGHSERRQHFGETDRTVHLKIRAALRHSLTPIVCVGESLEVREAGKTIDLIQAQLREGLGDLAEGEVRSLLIAYEPVWAIGTGRTASPAQAEEVQAFIRGQVEKMYGNRAASCAIILYGGSVKPANAYSLLKEKDIDGFLVGGASLEAESFLGIAREALRAYKEET